VACSIVALRSLSAPVICSADLSNRVRACRAVQCPAHWCPNTSGSWQLQNLAGDADAEVGCVPGSGEDGLDFGGVLGVFGSCVIEYFPYEAAEPCVCSHDRRCLG